MARGSVGSARKSASRSRPWVRNVAAITQCNAMMKRYTPPCPSPPEPLRPSSPSSLLSSPAEPLRPSSPPPFLFFHYVLLGNPLLPPFFFSIPPTLRPPLPPLSLRRAASNMLQLQLGRERTEREATALRTQLLERDAQCAHLDAEVTRGGGGGGGKPLHCRPNYWSVMPSAPIWMQR